MSDPKQPTTSPHGASTKGTGTCPVMHGANTTASTATTNLAKARRLLWPIKKKYVRDFVAAWSKVMNLDRFDLPARA